MDTRLLISRGQADFDLYPYTPSDIAGYIFLVLFGIAAVVHIGYVIILRSWFFIPFVLGCIGEAGGYYCRAWSHQNIRQGTPYLVQMMLILGSAPLMAASVYMTLGRFIRALDAEQHAVMRPSWTTKIFVLIDIASFACQIFGTAATASGPEGAKQGMTIVMGGLGVQLVAFVGFIAMSAVFHRRLSQEPTTVSLRPHVNWRRHMWMLYSVSTLVLVRSAFRLIEFAEGSEGVLMKTEALMYVFDASLLFLVAVCLAVMHPGMLLRVISKTGCFPGEEGAFIPLNDASK